jgi:dipeptidyl aminopeptidase/acylaminoacyl peptidase
MTDTPTPQFDVDTLMALPRLEGLALSPDGRRLITGIARPDHEGKKFVSALWELDTNGDRPPRRLTRSAVGESSPAFLPDGSLLFTSGRADPFAPKDDPRGEAPALWRLPEGGGEAYLIASPPGGVDTFRVARDSGTIVVASNVYEDSESWEDDAKREKARRDAGTNAHLFTTYPIRHWDQYLGPRQRRLHAAALPADDRALTDLTEVVPDAGRTLDLATFDITPDGGTVVVARMRSGVPAAEMVFDLAAFDTQTGQQRMLIDDGADYADPACSPDGRWVVVVREGRSTPEMPGDRTLVLVDLTSGSQQVLTDSLDRFPSTPVWAPDSSAVFFTADDDGHHLPYRAGLDGSVTRLAAEGSFTDLRPAADGRTVYALRSYITTPPHPVALDAYATDAEPESLPGAFAAMAMPGTVERLTTTSPSGEVRSWLLMPEGADADRPAPLAVLIHGGPVNSWVGWHWRWNPHLFTAKGYAVLMPDPALSTGYGLKNIQRGWGRWGEVVFDDLMATVDDVAARPEIDAEAMAALGGSFGGYMANWVAGHTDRFRAIVTHASLWYLEQFHGSTDLGVWWEREFGDPYADPQRYRDNSPHLFVGKITTPMLVTHGEVDYRVPIGETLKLWTDLQRHGVESQFLYFPDEHHWILKPGNSKVWYATVFAFLDHHVRGKPWQRPALV